MSADPFQVMQEFYLSDYYDPNAERRADTVQAAIAYTLAQVDGHPQGGDGTAPFMTSAVGTEGTDAPNPMSRGQRLEGVGEVERKTLNWTRQTVATWDRWTCGPYTAFKVAFDGPWQLKDGSGIVFTHEYLQAVMGRAQELALADLEKLP